MTFDEYWKKWAVARMPDYVREAAQCAWDARGDVPRQPETETVEFVTPCFVQGEWVPRTVRVTKPVGVAIEPGAMPTSNSPRPSGEK